MTVTINGTTGYSGPVGTIGDLTTTGNTTLGDASTDTLTLNGNTASIPNNLNFTGGNIGMGVTSPSYRLDVDRGASNGVVAKFGRSSGQAAYIYADTSAAFFASNASVTNGLGFYDSSNYFAVFTNSAERLRLDSSGNLGLGVTPGAWKSTWKSMDIGTAASFYSQDNNTTGVGSNLYFSGTNWYRKNTGLTALYQLSDGGHYWYSNPTGAAGSTFTPSSVMTLDASGNLGVGVTPSAWLTSYSNKAIQIGPVGAVYGNTVSAGNQQMAVANNLYLDSSANTRYITSDYASRYIQYAGQHRWDICASGTAGALVSLTQAMTLDANGTLSTVSSSSNAANFQYSGAWTSGNANFVTMYMPNMSGGTAGLALGRAGGTYNTSKIIFGYAGSNSTSNYLGLGFWDADSRLTIYPTGNATLTGSLTQNTSDIRLKTNIQPITNALLKVCSLNGFTHNWNDLAFELNHFNKEVREVGVFAQEVQAVLPEAVFIAPFDQEKGSPSVSASGKNYLTVQYEKLTPLLIEAIKELKAEFDAYKQTHL